MLEAASSNVQAIVWVEVSLQVLLPLLKVGMASYRVLGDTKLVPVTLLEHISVFCRKKLLLFLLLRKDTIIKIIFDPNVCYSLPKH